jgi:hypothetical protein
MICRVTLDRIDGKNVFLVKFYESMKDVISGKVSDIWECSNVIPDEAAMTYFEDVKIIESLR